MPPKGVQTFNFSPRHMWVVCEGHLIVSGIDAVNDSVAVAEADVDGMVMSGEMCAYGLREGAEASHRYLAWLPPSEAARELLIGMVTGTSSRTCPEAPSICFRFPSHHFRVSAGSSASPTSSRARSAYAGMPKGHAGSRGSVAEPPGPV